MAFIQSRTQWHWQIYQHGLACSSWNRHIKKKLINCPKEKTMWWNYPKGPKYSVLPDGLQEKHHLIRTMCAFLYDSCCASTSPCCSVFIYAPLAQLGKSFLMYSCFLSFFKAHHFEKLRENFIAFNRAVTTEGKRKCNHWSILVCFVLFFFLWLVSLSNTIEILRYKYWHPSGFTLSSKAHWTNSRDWL